MTTRTKKSSSATEPSAPSRLTCERVTITVPKATLQRVRARIAASGEGSLSAYIAKRLEESEQQQTFLEYLEELFREQPATEEEQRWADKLLGL